MKLNRLYLKHRPIFEKYLNAAGHELSVYSFANIFIWQKLFYISWGISDDNLCVFFKDKFGLFLYLSPLGRRISPRALQEAFMVMRRANSNPDFSRVENAEETDLGFYKGLGYSCSLKFSDYICKRQELAELKGNKFKSKRACANFFVKNNDFKFLTFNAGHQLECLKLYDLWMQERKARNADRLYQGMLSDSKISLKAALSNYARLGIQGRIVKIGGKVKAFSLGAPLSKDTFCILYEVADLSFKGLAQFIFREFCASLEGYEYINVMDDSGLQNLRRVKLSYHPTRLVAAYIVKDEPH